MANIIVSTLLQIGFALFIAWAAWMIARKSARFARFVGLVRAPPKLLLLGGAIGAAAAAFLLQVPGVLGLASGQGSVADSLRGDSIGATALAVIIVAVFKTSFTEELIFRGILAKWLIRTTGFAFGNALQAIAFGAIHLLLLLLPNASTGTVAIMVAFTSTTGWLNGWMKERLADGSILPGWVAHATANTLAYSAIAFDWV